MHEMFVILLVRIILVQENNTLCRFAYHIKYEAAFLNRVSTFNKC